MTVTLNASEQFSPERDLIKAGVKPFRLTVLFNYVETTENHPYGNDVAYEKITEIQDTEYFIDGVEIPYAELKQHLEKYFPDTDLDEITERLVEQALDEFHK